MEIKNLTPDMIQRCRNKVRLQLLKSIPFEDVEDIVEEVWMRVLESLDNQGIDDAFDSWVRKITERVIWHYYKPERKLGRSYARIFEIAIEERPHVEPEQESMAIFLDLVSKAKFGSVLFDHFYLGYGHTDLAEERGMSYDKIRHQYRSALRELKSLLEGESK